jgi:hypothetical protein
VNDPERGGSLAFDLMSLDGEDFRQEPFSERKAVLRKVRRRTRRGIQYVEHAEGHGDRLFEAICKLGLEGIVSKKLDAPYKSGPSKAWLKIKNPKAPAATFLHGPREGPSFYLYAACGPDCLVPPWLRTVGEPRTPRGSFISANGSASHRISMTGVPVCQI